MLGLQTITNQDRFKTDCSTHLYNCTVL